MWAWAHEESEDAPEQVDASDVIAVLVAHNGDPWLARTLVSLARMDVQPGRLIAVDAGSTDGTRELLDKGLHDGLFHAVVDGRAEEGFGANVALALEQGIDDDFQPDFLWLLHDDSAPSRRALSELLRASQVEAVDGKRPAILVPKLLHPKRRNHPDQMSAAGESVAPSGARVPSVDPGDIDQHQLEPARVLGASTAGILITMDAWRQLGGFDPAIPLFRDGVDLGWRANASGLLVRTAPHASLRHVEAGRVGLRNSVLAPDSAQADLAAGMSLVVMHSDKPGRTIARLSAQSVGSALGYLAGKSPRLAAGQLRAAAQVRKNRNSLLQTAAKYSAAGVDKVPAGLLPDRGWGVRRFFERIAASISDQYYDLIDDDDGGMIDELTGDDFAGGRRRARLLSPAIIGMLVMLVGSLVASRELLRFGLLAGPALVPAPASLPVAWANWAQADPGMAGSNAPWTGLMALGSTLTLGQPDWWASVLLLGGPALAAWAAFRFLHPISGPGWWTPVLACLWGVLLPLVGVTGRGSLDLTALAIGLPLLGIVLRRWNLAPTSGAEGLRAPAMVALLIAVLGASMPLALPIALVIAVVMAIRRRDVRGGLLALLGPAVLLAPWAPRLLADPGRLLVGADPATMPAGTAPDAIDVLLGAAHLPATPLWWSAVAIGLLWLVGLVGAVRSRQLDAFTRIALLVVALVPPVIAVLASRFVVDVAGVGVRLEPTGWLLVGLFGLLALAAHGIGRRPERLVDDSADDLADRARLLRERSLLGMAAAVALIACAAWWVVGGTELLSRGASVLPSYVTGVQDSTRATRTLLVDLSSGTAHFNTASASSPTWGDAETPLLSTDEQAADLLRQAAQQFAQGQPSDDLAARLRTLGIGHVWLRGATPDALTQLSSAPQLGMATVDAETVVFTVTTQPSRALLRTGDAEQGILDGRVNDDDPDAMIVLSSPIDPDWHAEIDGQPLPVADSGDWRQAWATEGRTGELSYRLGTDVFGVVWQTVMVLLLLVLAAPTVQKSQAPRRALAGTPRGRGGSRS